VRADPVHLMPDLHKLLLFDAASFDLDRHDAAELHKEINSQLDEPDLRLRFGSEPKRWYLTVREHPGFEAADPESIRGQHIGWHVLAQGRAAHWQRVSTEIQMILHESLCNAQRTARGEPAVNGIWLWGAGVVPRTAASFSEVRTDCAAAAGLAGLCGIPCSYPLSLAAPIAHPAGTLVVVRALQNFVLHGEGPASDELRNAVESELLDPLLVMLNGGDIDAIRLITDDLELNLTRRGLRRWWRRAKPLVQ